MTSLVRMTVDMIEVNVKTKTAYKIGLLVKCDIVTSWGIIGTWGTINNKMEALSLRSEEATIKQMMQEAMQL